MKKTLIEALKIIKEECEKQGQICTKCPLNNICEEAPYKWGLEDVRQGKYMAKKG